VSQLLELGYEAVDGLFKHQAKKTQAHQEKVIRVINLDEFALKKGHDNFALAISAPEEGYILDVLPNRERETLEKWLDGLSIEQRQAIKVVNVDMWEPYTLAVKAKLPLVALFQMPYLGHSVAGGDLASLKRTDHAALTLRQIDDLSHHRPGFLFQGVIFFEQFLQL